MHGYRLTSPRLFAPAGAEARPKHRAGGRAEGLALHTDPWTVLVACLAVFGGLSLVSCLLFVGMALLVGWQDERQEARQRVRAVERLLAESVQEHQR